MLTRRSFISHAAAAALLRPVERLALAQPARGEVLYNGIVLPREWPPALAFTSEHAVRAPYLDAPPPVIPIDVGRQLFVDDFLIAETNMQRSVHAAQYHPATPILRPDKPWEQQDDYADRTGTPRNPSAMVFSDGVFYDPADRRFKMWYMGGFLMSTCYAESDDGITWRKPSLDVVPGTNVVWKSHRDSSTVWLDQFARDPRQRYKMSLWNDYYLRLYASSDGVHWDAMGQTGYAGDRSTFFYNPFRNVWVFSVRAEEQTRRLEGRYRRYWESRDFASAVNWDGRVPIAWTKATSDDVAVASMARRAELYNLDCVAYESIMLGLFTIWRGESSVREKINEVTLGFSRDGFHWHRFNSTFAGVNDEPGSWNHANVQSAGGGCLIVGDRLHFYVSGRAGIRGTGAPGICTTGLATLRRDGFASMDWLPDEAPVLRHGPSGIAYGALTTRPIRFGGSHLFVNADTRGGGLRAEVLRQDGTVMPGFSRHECPPVVGDGTRLRVVWKGADLRTVAGQPVRIRFLVDRGSLFSFWISRWTTGESSGYPAAGGPGFGGPIDVPDP